MKLLLFGATLFSSALYGQSVTTVQYSSPAAAHDVIITEVLADPSPQKGLPPVEFVELYNRSQLPVNLAGWSFYEGSAKPLPAAVIPSGSYLIVCAASDTAWFSGYGPVAGLSSFSLTNGGEKLAIRDPSGITIDSLIYSDTWFNGTYKADGGWSLERIDTSFVCSNDRNWTPSEAAAGGTPGFANSVAGVFIDDEPPVPLRAYCPDNLTIKIIFSEAIDPGCIDSMEIVTVTGAPVLSVTSGGGDNMSVVITLSDSIPRGISFRCMISKVWDCPGNYMPGSQTVQFGIPDPSIRPDVIINEVLFNPPLDGEDFIELFNRGNNMADLTDFTIMSYDESSGLPDEVTEIDGDPWLLFPGEYAILTASPTAVALHYSSPYPKGFPPLGDLPAMNIDAGEIGILCNGTAMDRVRYSEDDHFEMLKDVKGISLERIDPYRPSADKSNWHSAAEPAGYATPGSINSQYTRADSQVSEVVADPPVFSPDNDGTDDVVTFRIMTLDAGYIGSIMIYHSEGRPVKQLASQELTGTEAAYSWDGTTDYGTRAPLGLYIAVLQFFSLEGDVRKFKVPVVLATKF